MYKLNILREYPKNVLNSSEFSILSNTCIGTLESEESCTFEAVFSPTAEGTKNASVSVVSDDPDTPTADIPLTGNGKVLLYSLSVSKSGSGTGSVTGNPDGISCGDDCSESYNADTLVTLTAAPESGSSFDDWIGCDSVADNQCTVKMNAAKTVTAEFSRIQYELTVAKNGTGTGSVKSDDAKINCGDDCSESYNADAVVTLTATPDSGSVFSGWSGGECSGTGTCQVTMNAAKTVTATFTRQYDLTVTKNGTGTVKSDIGNINCGTVCSDKYDPNQTVTLTATPGSNSRFVSWSGCDSSTGNQCTVTMSAAKTVNANFTRIYSLNLSKSGTGAGTVKSDVGNINCGTVCSDKYDANQIVTLTATPDANSVFNNWIIRTRTLLGTYTVKRVNGSQCTVTMNAAKSVTATFTRVYSLKVSKDGTGKGTVKSSMGKIDCGTVCSDMYEKDKTVTLTAAGDAKSTATAWKGCDSSNGNQCTVKMSAVKSVTATFTPDPICEAPIGTLKTVTIKSVKSGDWNTKDTWNQNRTPKDTDVVLVNKGHKVTNVPYWVTIQTLCNYGELISRCDSSMVIEATGGISNYTTGIIRGKDGGKYPYESGQDVTLQTAKYICTDTKKEFGSSWKYTNEQNPGPIYNDGQILGGNGRSSGSSAGEGGDVIVLGRNVTNTDNGKIIGGRGGDASNGWGGHGGKAHVFGRLGGGFNGDSGGELNSTGEVKGGDAGYGGGNGGKGGNGGDLWLVSRPNVSIGGRMRQGSIQAEEQYYHRAGYGGLPNGKSGKVIIEPSVIEIGAGTQISGNDVTIFGGDDFVLNLSNAQGTVIDSVEDIVLAVGSNGVVNLTGNTEKLLKTEGRVSIYADEILMDPGVVLSDIIQASEIITAPAKILYDVLLTGADQVAGAPGATITVRVTLLNGGPKSDTYNLKVSNSEGWSADDSVQVPELDSLELGIDVTLPSTIGEASTITFTATSQADPTVSSTMEVRVLAVADDNTGSDDSNDNNGTGNNADTDDDNDGLPDVWETANGLNPLVNDASIDSDGDGYSNLDEYTEGTNPNDPDDYPETSCSDPATCPGFTAGLFKVGKDDIVKVDFLYDGGMYEGELGVFSLAGMESLTPNSPEFIAEAVKRVLSDSEQGHIVLSDKTEGARFSGQLGSGKEPNRNKGIYKGLKSCKMNPGDTFATVLVPNATFTALAQNPGTTDAAKRPIFSLASSNPEHEMYFGQMAKIEDIGNAFVFEDMSVSDSDRDFNDLIIQILGVTVSAPTLDNPELGFKEDWRKSQNPVIPHIEVSPPSPDTLWMTITLKSPADLFVYDPQGNVIGKEGGSIPGATFETDANGHQIVSLPKLDSGEYRIVLRAIGEGGLCHLEIKGYQGENELTAKETPFTIGAHETYATIISADDFLDSTVIDFAAPDFPVSESGKVLHYDYDADGKSSEADIVRVSGIWNKCRGDAEFDEFFDIDGDGCITVKDIMKVAGEK